MPTALTVFILGADSPGMKKIEEVLKAGGHLYRHATKDGTRVRLGNAYEADNPECFTYQRSGYSFVFVDCKVEGVNPNWVKAIDSIGQLRQLLNLPVVV